MNMLSNSSKWAKPLFVNKINNKLVKVDRIKLDHHAEIDRLKKILSFLSKFKTI